jgi:hypothetical protein
MCSAKVTKDVEDMTSRPAVSVITEEANDYPFANSEATRMLRNALELIEKNEGKSQRVLARQLGYKSSVGLSHMALGRVPIPIDRVIEFARMFKMDAREFLFASLRQRHPDIDFKRVLSSSKDVITARQSCGVGNVVKEELEALAGKPLDELTPDVVDVLRDVCSYKEPMKRWISLGELSVIEAVRRAFPKGLSTGDRMKLIQAISSISSTATAPRWPV